MGGSLTSRLLDATAAKSGEKVWAEFWLMGDIDYDDLVALEVSTDAKQWSTVRTFGGYATKIKTKSWQVYVEELPNMAGKKFLLRLRFRSGNCINNNQRGLFLDDLKIHLAPPCGQYDPYDHGYSFYNIGSVNGSQPTNRMEPPFTLSANESDSVMWYQPDSYSSNKKPRVYVKWAAGDAKVQVCASFECYKSKGARSRRPRLDPYRAAKTPKHWLGAGLLARAAQHQVVLRRLNFGAQHGGGAQTRRKWRVVPVDDGTLAPSGWLGLSAWKSLFGMILAVDASYTGA